MKMLKRNRTNFTLIELLVVMLLMGILMTLMLPAFNRMISGNKVDQIASGLKLGLEQAQSHAITSRRNVAVILPNGSSWGSDDTVKQFRMGGFSLAYVRKNTAGNWEFVNWVPGATWKNKPDGAMLVQLSNTASSMTTVKNNMYLTAAKTKITDALGTELISVQGYPTGNGSSAAAPANCAVIFTEYGNMANDTLYLVVSEAIANGDNLVFPTRDSSNRSTNFKILKVNQFTGRVEYF